MWGEECSGSCACLFAAILLLGQLDLAHTASADGLAKDPFPGLGGYSGARSGLGRGGRGPRISSSSSRLDGSRPSVVGDGASHICGDGGTLR